MARATRTYARALGAELPPRLLVVVQRVVYEGRQLNGLLQAFPDDFLYGNIAADVIVGKNLAPSYDLHAHNWKNGFRVLDEAKSERQQAFALGYLAHLASDTIAHNYFVPYKLVESYEAVSLRHLYWEVRFDHLVHQAEPGVAVAWRRIAGKAYATHDELIEATVPTTIFSYRTGKLLFDSGMLVQRLGRWNKMVGLLARRSAYPLDLHEFHEIKGLATAAVASLLVDLAASRATVADPTGLQAIGAANRMRKDLKRASPRVSAERFDRHAVDVRSSFRQGIYGVLRLPSVPDSLP